MVIENKITNPSPFTPSTLQPVEALTSEQCSVMIDLEQQKIAIGHEIANLQTAFAAAQAQYNADIAPFKINLDAAATVYGQGLTKYQRAFQEIVEKQRTIRGISLKVG